ncbi:hypothetical protein BJ508DRAFT_316216, partial [Ascobolus immersus RN42]
LQNEAARIKIWTQQLDSDKKALANAARLKASCYQKNQYQTRENIRLQLRQKVASLGNPVPSKLGTPNRGPAGMPISTSSVPVTGADVLGLNTGDHSVSSPISVPDQDTDM